MNTEQHITATVTIAGRQHVTITTHGDGGPGSVIQLAYLGILISLHDRRAVDRYAALWNDAAARIYAQRLPRRREMEVAAGQSAITLAIRASHTHTDAIAPVELGVSIRIGSVRWIVVDRDAYETQILLWDRVILLADLVLPKIA